MFSFDGRMLFLTLAGSHAHGTARGDSDVDLRGVCLAPPSIRLSLFQSFEQYEGALPAELADTVLARLAAHPSASCAMTVRTECVIFDIAKFLRLCADTNPNALEILFADERDHVHVSSSFSRLRAERHRFLTSQVEQTFLRYALSQLKRIRSHRSWLLRPPSSAPCREDFDEEEAWLAEKKRWDAYEAWKSQRNPVRAELERKYGYDTKHAMHLVRLMRMGLEALEQGDLSVRRGDSAELRAIRDGELSFERLIELSSDIERAMHKAAETTSLPPAVDRAWVDEVLRSLILADLRG